MLPPVKYSSGLDYSGHWNGPYPQFHRTHPMTGGHPCAGASYTVDWGEAQEDRYIPDNADNPGGCWCPAQAKSWGLHSAEYY